MRSAQFNNGEGARGVGLRRSAARAGARCPAQIPPGLLEAVVAKMDAGGIPAPRAVVGSGGSAGPLIMTHAINWMCVRQPTHINHPPTPPITTAGSGGCHLTPTA